jgi:Flp pilus assembly protein TadD
MVTQRPAEAKHDFLRLVDLDPRNAYAWANLGSLYANAGERRAAATAYRKALDAAPADWAHRAEVEKSLQRLGE